jgi:tetratricopeptide (TPR) repeat protein
MRRTLLAAACAAIIATPADAGPLQDEVNAAQEAYDAGKFADAVTRYADVLKRIDTRAEKNRASAGILRGRLGASLARLGRPEEAAAELDAALALLPTEADRDERAFILVDLGRVRETLLDYPGARAAYERAIADRAATQTSADAFWAQLGLARVTLFSDPAVARRALDSVIPAAEQAFAGKKPADTLGDIYSLRGRIELNAGQLDAARGWFEKALKTAGGLSTRVSLADTRIRGDLALAHHLAGRSEEARKYIAYTGAGRLREGSFSHGAATPLPACGPTTGIEPDDVAVIEFAVSDRGVVTGATPIYVSRRGTEMEFLRAVKGWSWRPDQLTDIDPFWRAAVRLEMRCAGTAPINGALWRSFQPLTVAWFQGKGVTPPPGMGEPDAVALPKLQAELARREAAYGPASPQLLPVLDMLAFNNVTDQATRDTLLARRVAVAEAASAPPEVSASLRVSQALWTGVKEGRSAMRAVRRHITRERLPAVLTAISPDRAPRSYAWALAELGQGQEEDRDIAGAEASYQRILALQPARLPANDPIRQLAQLRLASLAAAAGQLDRARALIAETGLTPEQCALVDLQPVQTRSGGGSNDFPGAAMAWGFDGWARIGYDVDSAGRPVGVRTVLAYPPLIFGESAERIVKRFRFRPIFRDGSTTGCLNKQQGINFISRGL